MINIKRLGHVVLRVANLQQSKEFYLKFSNFYLMEEEAGLVAFIGLEGHGNILDLVQTTDPSASATHKDFASRSGLGLQHFAFEFDSHEDLKSAYDVLKSGGVKILDMLDHGSTESVYFADPDGNIVEYCFHRPDGWQKRMEGLEDHDEKIAFDD